MAAPIHQGTRLSFQFSGENEGDLVGVQNGEHILVNVRWGGTGTISTLNVGGASGGVGGTNMTLLGSPQTGGPDNWRSQWAILEWTGSAGDKLVYVNVSGSPSGGVEAWRISGANAATPVGSRNGASGSGTAVSVDLTSCPAECIGFAIGTNNGGDWSSPGDSWSLLTVGDAGWYDSGAQKSDLGTSGTKTVSATIASGTWVVNAIAIAPTGGGGGSSAPAAYANQQNMMH